MKGKTFKNNTNRRFWVKLYYHFLGREIAYALVQYGASPEDDMHELWRRIVFNIMIANTDDHLRNHGFISDPVF